jgi:hypothetical protein
MRATASGTRRVTGARYGGITVTDQRGRVETPAAIGPFPALLDDMQAGAD